METTQNQGRAFVYHTDSYWESQEVKHIYIALHAFHSENICIEKRGEASINASVKRKYVKLDDKIGRAHV